MPTDAPRPPELVESRLLEVCVADLRSAIEAERGGAGRIELCSEVDVGGVTPGAGLIAAVLESVSIPVHVLIRPRSGDFVIDAYDRDVILREIDQVRRLGAAGLVVGALRPDRSIDAEATSRFLDRAGPSLALTFHRAIDETLDPVEAADRLAGLGVRRVLSAGGSGPARSNVDTLRLMSRAGEGRLVVIVGGGISVEDLPDLLDRTGLSEVHVHSAATGPRPDPTPFGRGPGRVERARVRVLVDRLSENRGARGGVSA